MSDRPDEPRSFDFDGFFERFAVRASLRKRLRKLDQDAIDQARREGYAAGVRAAAEMMDRLGAEVENIDSFYRTAGELHMAEIGAAAIRALYGKGDGA